MLQRWALRASVWKPTSSTRCHPHPSSASSPRAHPVLCAPQPPSPFCSLHRGRVASRPLCIVAQLRATLPLLRVAELSVVGELYFAAVIRARTLRLEMHVLFCPLRTAAAPNPSASSLAPWETEQLQGVHTPDAGAVADACVSCGVTWPHRF
jgi:hypothetical protein